MISTYALTYPSPHNSQPIRLRIVDDVTAELYYDKACGLPAESYGAPFGFVCVGVFLEICSIAAHDLGYELTFDLNLLEDMDFKTLDLHKLGPLKLHKVHNKIPDFPVRLLLRRQTSRLPYKKQLVPVEVLNVVREEARSFGHTWHDSSDQTIVDDIIAVNQKTLFYDLENKNVRNEISHWLRYSKKEAQSKADGLSAETMHVNGLLLKTFIGLHFLWRLPLLGSLAKNAYLNTMRGVRQVGWITGPFSNNQEYFTAGRLFIRTWLHFVQAGVAIHPFGSVITNPRSHQEFCAIVDENEKDGMAWMLMRIGFSKTPPKSFRRGKDDLLI